MKEKLLSTLKSTLILCLMAGVIGLAANHSDKQQAALIYLQARQMAQVGETSQAAMISSPEEVPPPTIDLAALQAKNSDVIGWISIPGTAVSYPLLQTQNNSFYLGHAWDKSSNSAGSIFLECQCPADFSAFNTIVYGHRMEDGSMFGSLHNYSSAEYWQQHPSIYVTLEEGTLQYDVFAAFVASVTDIVYGLDITDAAVKQNFLEFCLSSSAIDTGILPTARDQVLTLSTCTQSDDDTRWVVVGVLRGITHGEEGILA